MDHDLVWKYAEDYVTESPSIGLARQHSAEFGIDPVSPAVGAQLRLIAVATAARNILEIGTGAGVSGLHLLESTEDAMLTTIDVEPDYQSSARASFTTAGIAPNRFRFIAGTATTVLPRMNDAAYDLVLVDADPYDVLAYVEHGLRTVRTGGTVLVARALWGGRVPDPVQRSRELDGYRGLLETVLEFPAVEVSLSTAGDGLLQLVKRG